MRTPRLLLAPLAVLLLALGACSDDGDPDDGPGGTDRTGGTEGSAAGGPLAALERRNQELLARPCTTEPTLTDGLTDPGQVLCLGTPATLPVRSTDDDTGTMRLLVTGFEQGDDAQIDERLGGFGWASDTHDLWFARAEARLLSEETPGGLDRTDPFGILWNLGDTDGEAGDKGLAPDPDGCESADFDEAPSPGERFETCVWAVLPEGTVPDYLSWVDTDAYDIGLNDAGGLFWKAS
ncbi:hypothetical protein ABFT23_13790 [Nocardioides sp. C4-1]|uniref:hypothetical protein n=1 Tax=Nocardioides sp. C4-1 TaxID=3151851 RepID=UPI003265EC23